MFKLYNSTLAIIAFPSSVAYFFRPEVGRNYNVGFFKKLELLFKFIRNTKKIPTSSSWREHLEIAVEIFKIPPDTEGVVCECGTYKGGSTANLSLVCRLVNRKLVVCDSFMGLPNPNENDKRHYLIHSSRYLEYQKGDYKGSLEEVKKNITTYGCISVCKFIPGYYEQTLSNLSEKLTLVFLDVDLVESLKTCLTNLWPHLQTGCKLFSHEALNLNFISLFFDKEWWRDNLKSFPPGFVGAGTGLPTLIRTGSSLGYTLKNGELSK